MELQQARPVAPDPPYEPDPAIAAVKTWRSLRLAMVLLVVGLATAVVHEHLRAPGDCWQTSLSAYYYTPAQGFLVGALVTIGVCLVALKGNTDWEDVLLNLAGGCAPFVALVPSSGPGACGSVVLDPAERDLSVANNVTALLVVAGLTLVVAVALTTADHVRRRDLPTRLDLVGLGLAVVLFGATVLVFVRARAWFTANGHWIAAVVMLTFFFLVVCLNARHLSSAREGTARPARAANRYAWVAGLMAGAVVTHVLLRLAGWDLWLLSLEASLIGLFAVFWLLQTVELWNQGLRQNRCPVPPGTAARRPAPSAAGRAGRGRW